MTEKPRCFIAMPVATHTDEAERYEDPDHWEHVMHTLFIPAASRAGFEPVAPTAQGSSLIHANIVKQLQDADLVLCDLSSHNPNVFFELGVRTSLNLPVALVSDEHTRLPFDVSGINTHSYQSTLRGWDVPGEVTKLASHLESSAVTCNGQNPLWEAFGLTLRATEALSDESPQDARLDLVLREFGLLRRTVESIAALGIAADVTGTTVVKPAGAAPSPAQFVKLDSNDPKAPAPVRQFANSANVFRDEFDRPIEFFRVIGDDATVYIKQSVYDAIPTASRRALFSDAESRRIGVSVIPS
jgi:nucleoside 2-deoxyribosyltransferase